MATTVKAINLFIGVVFIETQLLLMDSAFWDDLGFRRPAAPFASFLARIF
jgi:hypothetical protein